MTATRRPGKYIEYDFPLREVNRLAQREANAKKPIYTMHKWWARRLSCVFRTVLLASAIDWADWDSLEPWLRDADSDFVDKDGRKIMHERDYHKRVRDTRPVFGRSNNLLDRPPTAWERLYYRLDDEANAVIGKAFRGKLVLDPFMGGGTTIVEALRLGADVAGCDLNPVAWYVVKKETDGIEPAALEAAFEQVKAAVAQEILDFYRTRCPACSGTADVMYTFWVKSARCQERTCGAEVPLYNSFVVARKAGKRQVPASKAGAPGMRLADGAGRDTTFLVCPACGEVYASFEAPADGTTCPACSRHTPPDLVADGYAGGGKYTCPACGHSHAILDAAKQQGRLPYTMYALEVYCPHCAFKGYKKPEAGDLALYERARQRFEAERALLNLPDQEIPIGLGTTVEHNLPGHGLRKWTDMFNERQLLLQARLRDAILAVEDANAREYLLLAWSAAIEFSNMFCRYNAQRDSLEGLFASHAYIPKVTFAENNLWGGEFGRGTFRNYVTQIKDALTWTGRPNDNLFQSEDQYTKIAIPEQSFTSQGKRLLLCRSSENLHPLADGQAALVITDPPYYGNVMYAELADFFYVWLRTALRDAYPASFAAPLTPKDEEIVETVTRGHGAEFLTKDETFFTGGLTRVFAEAGRVLDDDGLLVFTFHHQANEAWAAVLKTVLDAGFYVKAFYPVHAEMVSSLHIRDKANISYDALIVCREQHAEPAGANWQDIADRIYLRAERLVKELENGGRDLLPEDIYVIAVGQCLEEYSRHYYRGRSYVTWQGQPVGIEAALDGDEGRGIQGIGGIVDQLVEEAEGRLWPSGLDPVSRFYVLNFLGQSDIPYDRLKRRLQHNPHVSFDLLARQQLVRLAGGKARVTPELARTEYLLAKLGGVDPAEIQPNLPGFDMDDISALDRLHMLYVLDQRGALTGNLIARWAPNSTFVQLARRVAERLDPEDKRHKVYQRIADALSGQATFRMS